MKFIYCPAQIRTALTAAGLDLRILLDLEKISGILSPDDVGIILHANLDTSRILPPCIGQSLTNAYVYSDKPGPEVPWERIKTNQKQIRQIINDLCLNENGPEIATKDMKVTCDLMDENTLVFSHTTLETGEASSVTPEGLRVLLDRLIQQLVIHQPFEEVALLPLFKEYLTVTQAQLQ